MRQPPPTLKPNYIRTFMRGINDNVWLIYGIQTSICLIVANIHSHIPSMSLKESEKAMKIREEGTGRKLLIVFYNFVGSCLREILKVWKEMAGAGVEELVVQLEKSMDLSNLELGIKLVGTALANKNLNKWGVRNILRASWKEMGVVEIKWVKDNTFIIIVNDESTAAKIID